MRQPLQSGPCLLCQAASSHDLTHDPARDVGQGLRGQSFPVAVLRTVTRFNGFLGDSLMFALSRLQQFRLFHVFDGLAVSHAFAFRGIAGTRTAERRAAEALALMPPHLRADAGLPPAASQETEHPALTKARSRGRNWG